MSEVKTYQIINDQASHLNFGITKMETTFNKRGGKVDVPHRHDFYTILIVRKAKGIHKIDFNAYNFKERQIFFVAPGQVHQVNEFEQPTGYALTFSNDFLIENAISLSFIDGLNLFHDYGQSPPLIAPSEQFEQISYFLEHMLTLNESTAKMKNLSIGAYLKLLLIECNAICQMNPIELESASNGDHLIRRFKTEVDSNYKKQHSTKFYAKKLAITPDHLNRTIKSKIRKTAKEYVQGRIITEAKRLLYFTDLSNKEIGYKLGFSEPANFSAFFKKLTSLSPSNFRKEEGLNN